MRIQDRYFLFFMSSIVVLATGFFGRYYFANPSNSLHTMPGGLTIIVGAVLFCYNGYKMLLWQSRAKRFRYHFGITPPDFSNSRTTWKKHSAIQPIVDSLLESRASDLDDAIVFENVALKEMPTKTLAEAEHRAKEILARAEFVEGRKKYFWMLHNLAFEWGFEVWNSHKKYLSQLERAGNKKIRKQF